MVLGLGFCSFLKITSQVFFRKSHILHSTEVPLLEQVILIFLGRKSTVQSTVNVVSGQLVLRLEGVMAPHRPGSEVHALPAILGLAAVSHLVVVVTSQDEPRAREDGIL